MNNEYFFSMNMFHVIFGTYSYKKKILVYLTSILTRCLVDYLANYSDTSLLQFLVYVVKKQFLKKV